MDEVFLAWVIPGLSRATGYVFQIPEQISNVCQTVIFVTIGKCGKSFPNHGDKSRLKIYNICDRINRSI